MLHNKVWYQQTSKKDVALLKRSCPQVKDFYLKNDIPNFAFNKRMHFYVGK